MSHIQARSSSYALSVLLALSILLQPCHAYALEARDKNNSLPAPVIVHPDQNWDGIDGSWNTFALRIGEPAQYIRALVSTASQQTWAVHSEACNATADPNCYDGRGRTYDITKSNTWDEVGFYQLWTEKNLGLSGNGQYGYDTVGLGTPGEEGPTIKNTTVGTLVTADFWLGHLGVNAKSTNFSAFSDPSPSYMTYLFQQNHIPSISFAYTAGAQYHFATVLGSLTLGGYDASRFIPNDLTFGFAPDNERDIVVGVVGIHATSATKSNVNLLKRDQFTMYIDSTVAELWLPTEICDAFESAFGLKYDNKTELYLVDDLLHETLLADNATVTFSLGQKFSTNATVDIELPYAAFDLEVKNPYRGVNKTTKYFPIRRAEKENQFVLGRTFLQEAYLIVDWERQNFSVSQINWVYGEDRDIVPIISPTYGGDGAGGSSGQQGLTTGAIIGIALGGGFAVAMIAFGIAWFFWRKRQHKKMEQVKAEYAKQAEEAAAAAKTKEPPAEKREEPPTSPIEEEGGSNVFPKAELPAEYFRRAAGPDSKDGDPTSPVSFGIPSPIVEVENTERQIFEMPGDIPTRQEVDGRQLSEKETMMVRERMYNGVDPTGPPAVSPTWEEPPRRQAPVSPSEVAMVRRQHTSSPTTPRTPRDGAFLESSDTFFQPPPPRVPRDGRYLEMDDTLLSPISPLEGSTDTSRRRFSYES